MPPRKSFLDLAIQTYFKAKKLIEIREKALNKTLDMVMHAADRSKIDVPKIMDTNFDMYLDLYKKLYFQDELHSGGNKDKFIKHVKNKLKDKALNAGAESVIDFFGDLS